MKNAVIMKGSRKAGTEEIYGKIHYGTGCRNDKQQMHFIQQKRRPMQHGAEGIYTVFSTTGLGRA